ncbi:SDR family oxidoreductase [Caldilinea sp.]|uniref:SDR family oxidoreductase n=1 Tax=Caldilinea sp. TaxID=2293560 RepID=UPI002BE81B65|nr:SDR family oxidoreductase [Caldilinea sp.]
MAATILVTGASGNVGAEIVKLLLAEGLAVRAADRKPARLTQRFGDQLETVEFDFVRPETYAAAFAGVESMFLMRPPQITDVKKYIAPALDVAQQAGVRHVVFLSLIGIENNQQAPHYAVEQYLVASPMSYTFLRASFFMQNLNTTHRDEIRKRSELFVPVGKGKTSFIDVRDIAAVGALALSQPSHENKAYDLTGSEALDYYQVAEIFSEVLGRPITYRNPSSLSFLWRQVRGGASLPFAVVMTWLYNSTRKGMAAQVTEEVQRLLGRPPITFRQYVVDYQDVWR